MENDNKEKKPRTEESNNQRPRNGEGHYDRPRRTERPRNGEGHYDRPRRFDKPRDGEGERRYDRPRRFDKPRDGEGERHYDRPRRFDKPRDGEGNDRPRRFDKPRDGEGERHYDRPRRFDKPRDGEGNDRPRRYDKPRDGEGEKHYDRPRRFDKPRDGEGERRYDRPRRFDKPRDGEGNNERPRRYDKPRDGEGERRFERPRTFNRPKRNDREGGYGDQEGREFRKPREIKVTKYPKKDYTEENNFEKIEKENINQDETMINEDSEITENEEIVEKQKVEFCKHLGKIETYEVDRETNLGYVLINEEDDNEYFLHHNECNGKSFIPGDKVKAFLYVDKKNRLAATLFPPLIEVNQTALLKVMGVRQEIGVFMNIGISKDILLSADDLPKDFREWPLEGDMVPCEMRIRANRLVLRISSKPELLRMCKKETRLNKDDVASGYVYRLSPEGINLVTEEFDVIFIYKTNFRKRYHLGELVETKIIDIHEDDYSGTIIKTKEFQIVDDEEIVVDYLRKNNGVMLITEKSSPELINKLFNMSKSAFKNALGKLYKEKKIEILETKIILLEEI